MTCFPQHVPLLRAGERCAKRRRRVLEVVGTWQEIQLDVECSFVRVFLKNRSVVTLSLCLVAKHLGKY